MPALNIIELIVDAKIHSYARIYSSLIEDEYQRKRSYASIVALYALSNMIEKSNADVQKSMTLFKHPKLNEEYEISDFYVNNWHIDVRILVDGDAVLLPKKHFDNNILPDFYAVVKVDKSLNNASLLGFIDPKTVNKQPLDYHYYTATIDSLITYGEFLQKVEVSKNLDFAEEEHQKFKEKYLTLLDEELDIETKSSIIRHIFSCPMCRTEFCCFTGFEMVSSNMGKYPELMEDQTLDIIGATSVDDSKYEGKELIIPITDEAEEELLALNDNPQEIIEEKEAVIEEKEEVVEVSPVQEVNDFSYEGDSLETIEGNHEELNDDGEELVSLENIDDDNEIVEYEAPTQIVEENEIVENQPQAIDYQTEENDFQMATHVEEKEETISDILDELFGLDEDEEDEVVREKSLVVEPQQSKYEDDVETLEDDTENVLDDIQQPIDEPSDLVIDNQIESPTKKIEYYDDTNHKYSNSELEIYADDLTNYVNKESSEIENIDDNYENIDFHNVIVDYDEMGNPIYSYITDVPDNSVSKEKDNYESQNIEESNMNETPIDYQEIENKKEQENYDDYDILDEQYKSYSQVNKQEDEYGNVSYAPSTPEVVDEAPVYEQKQEDYMEESSDEYVENYTEDDVDVEEIQQDDNDEDENRYSSEFDDENYVDETDESIPDERVSNGNPLLGIVVLLAFITLSAFGGYKVYQTFFADKTEKMANVVENEDIASELNTEEMLSQPVQTTSNFEESVVENASNVELTDSVVSENNVSTDAFNLPKLPNVALSENNSSLTERDLLSVKENSSVINKSMASAFSANSTPAMVKNINWLCTPQLFTDTAFKAFLQDVDGLLKLNMRKNILNATETPKNRSVSVKMAIDNSGKIEKIMMAESSGSEQIDNIVLQSINESLTGKKSPSLSDSKLKADRYHLKVVIKL